jgi:thiamine-monophosphate kinase
MIDDSDGFAADLGHILDASGVGVVLDHVPAADGATPDEALSGGEDYELVFTCPPGTPVEAEFATRGLRPPIRVGTIAAESVRLLKGEPLTARGWEHPVG